MYIVTNVMVMITFVWALVTIIRFINSGDFVSFISLLTVTSFLGFSTALFYKAEEEENHQIKEEKCYACIQQRGQEDLPSWCE